MEQIIALLTEETFENLNEIFFFKQRAYKIRTAIPSMLFRIGEGCSEREAEMLFTV